MVGHGSEQIAAPNINTVIEASHREVNLARDTFVSSAPAQMAAYAQQNPNTIPDQFRNPINARELANTTLRSVDRVLGPNNERIGEGASSVERRHTASDLLADLEREIRRIMPEETPEHRRNIAEELIKQYLQSIGTAASRLLLQAYQDPALDQQQRAQMRDAGLRMGLTNANIQNEYGDTQAQTRFLLDTSRNLSNDQQREDMLRAAEMMGFAANAVFAAASLSGIGSQPSAQQQGSTIAQALASTASERARELMTNMREHLDEARTDQTRMEDFELDRRALARLVGEGAANKIARQLETQDGQNDQAVLTSVREQVELARRLHNGELSIRVGRLA